MECASDDYEAAVSHYTTIDTTTKIAIRFKAIGRAPILKQQVYRITASEMFHTVTAFLRKQLRLKDDAALVCDSKFY